MMPIECIEQTEKDITEFQSLFGQVKQEVQKAFIGQDELVEHLLYALFAQGHVLLEGVPGLGKTVLAKTLSRVIHMGFERIQCTPDLMPSDIIGCKTLVDLEGHGHQIVFEHGPIMANFVLVDEINRATPKSQSALLEAMQEGQVTVGRERISLPSPQLFVATQNPIEHEGTYPLPEAQLDRFMVKLNVSHPTRDDYRKVIELTTRPESVDVEPVLDMDQLNELQRRTLEVEVPERVQDIIIELIEQTHPSLSRSSQVKENVALGASPRAVQSVVRLAKVAALSQGRSAVSLGDVKCVYTIALRHRVLLNFTARARKINVDDLLETVLEGCDGVAR